MAQDSSFSLNTAQASQKIGHPCTRFSFESQMSASIQPVFHQRILCCLLKTYEDLSFSFQLSLFFFFLNQKGKVHTSLPQFLAAPVHWNLLSLLSLIPTQLYTVTRGQLCHPGVSSAVTVRLVTGIFLTMQFKLVNSSLLNLTLFYYIVTVFFFPFLISVNLLIVRYTNKRFSGVNILPTTLLYIIKRILWFFLAI